MVTLASIRRMFSGCAIRLVVALGICSIALMLSACAGVDDGAGNGPSETAADDKATDDAEEAPTGFNNSTNGFEAQDAFDKDREKFEEVEGISDGLGPVYNATSCVSCHQNPVSGSSSQVAEIRAGHHERDPRDPRRIIFIEPPGGSLIHQR